MMNENWQERIAQDSFLQMMKTDFSVSDCEQYKARIEEVFTEFEQCFGEKAERLFSSPGRTEICGNHTDHQRGKVLAGSVNLDILATVRKNDSNKVCVQSKGYLMDEIDLSDLSVHKSERNTSKALIRGVLAAIQSRGYTLGGFDAYTISNVLQGSGLSSSAAFEVLIAKICSVLFCEDALSEMELAQIGQYAENVYYGKPCGLMDQAACAIGGVVAIDFSQADHPTYRKINPDLQDYAICILDSGADHANLTHEYSAIPKEMKAIASAFQCEVLSEVTEADFYASVSELRKQFGDRAVLRAMHFFEENNRIDAQADALEQGRLEQFFQGEKESAKSSYEQLQNVLTSVYPPEQQAVAFTIQYAEHLLKNRGAVRIHGGGFAGTVQAFVPSDFLDAFQEKMEQVLGKGKCYCLKIRNIGVAELK